MKAQPARPELIRDQARYEALCRGQPGNFQAWWNLARINLELGRAEPALVAFERALALKPAHIEALIGKILACRQLGRLDEALATAERALALAPANSDLLLHQGHLLKQLGRNEAALAVYERLLAMKNLPRPKWLYALSVKVALLTDLCRYPQALAAVDQGLALAPDSPVFLLNRSSVSIWLGEYEETLASLDKLAARQPLDFGGLSNRAQALASLRRFDAAEAVLQVLRERYPQELREREFFLPNAVIPTDAVAFGYTAWGMYFNGMLDALGDCEWRYYAAITEELATLAAAAQCREPIPYLESFRLLSLPSAPDLRLAAARARARHIDQAMAPLRERLQLVHATRRPGERLRIGYVSGDFREHPTAHLMRKLFRVHDRSRLEITAYSLYPGDDSLYWKDIAAACDRVTILAALSNADAARCIAQDGIHILVDLHGYTRLARPEIFALRPAPVQASYLGFPGTLGADFIPYLIADRIVLPEAQLGDYSEQPVYLPECYQVNDNAQPIAETGVSRADQGLPQDAFVYCCFNAAHKIDPVTFAVWMRILKQVPDSVLWLLFKNARAADNLRRAAAGHGVDPQRLLFGPRVPKAEHLERHRLADLFLDTFIYNAHSTASDALWAGLPVITLCGQTFPARVGASLLSAIGLSELITYNERDFEDLAVVLAGARERLAELRLRLHTHRPSHPLFDTERFARHLERAFEMLWEAHEAGGPAQPVVVQPRVTVPAEPP